jgi:hypothetical protein
MHDGLQHCVRSVTQEQRVSVGMEGTTLLIDDGLTWLTSQMRAMKMNGAMRTLTRVDVWFRTATSTAFE